MSYQYDPQKGFDREKPDNDIGSWVLIGIMFMVFWPAGLFLLISKLTDETKKKPQQQRTTAGGAYTSTTTQQSAPKQGLLSRGLHCLRTQGLGATVKLIFKKLF